MLQTNVGYATLVQLAIAASVPVSLLGMVKDFLGIHVPF